MKKIQNKLAMSTIVAILLGLLIVAVTGVIIYRIYTIDAQIKEAMQLAKNENRMVEFSTSNGIKAAFNVSSKSKFEMILDTTQVVNLVVYPRNHKKEYYSGGKGTYIAQPYGLETYIQ